MFLCNNIHKKPPFKKKKKKKNQTGYPTDNYTPNSFFTCVEHLLGSMINSHQKIYSNLTLKEKKALSDLKNNISIATKPCEKGGCICIMNTREYLTHTCKITIPTNHEPTTQKSNNPCLHSHTPYASPTHIDKATMEFLLPSKNPGTPLFCWPPTLHKQD